ncbi:hypothetical protein FGIG_03193 [Fasciola gigantica]|uniref:Uncharacterized protein n=1 Tax=Fasciola gigantica TaxID=46835 RepID=A0A504YNL6_FASGI|nr:hypothetical protein FGIG_03193 [Fasciola gigantica]
MGTVVSVGVCPSKSKSRQKKLPIQEPPSVPEISQPETGTEESDNRHQGTDCQRSRGKNKRVAVLLGNCHEEYQTLADELPEIILGQVEPHLKEHPMIKYWIILNVRSDPCLFSYVDGDWHPYSLRNYKEIQITLQNAFKSGLDMDADELSAREEILEDLKALRGDHFYFYDDITFFEDQPKTQLASHPDYLMVSEEVYQNAISKEPRMRYIRLNFSRNRFPMEDEIDRLVSVVRELCNEILPKNQFAKADTSDVGEHLIGVIVTGRKLHDGTVQLGMSIAHLILRALHSVIVSINPSSPVADAFNKKSHKSKPEKTDEGSIFGDKVPKNGENYPSRSRPGYKKRSECQLLTTQHQKLKAGKFQFLRHVGRYLSYMAQIKEEVDKAIEDCSEVINLREEILETVLELESKQFSYDMGVSP